MFDFKKFLGLVAGTLMLSSPVFADKVDDVVNSFNSRRIAFLKDLHGKTTDSAGQNRMGYLALAKLRYASLTGDTSKVAEANSYIQKVCDQIIKAGCVGCDAVGSSSFSPWHGHPSDIARAYLMYKDSGLLTSSTKTKILNAYRYYQKYVCELNDAKHIGFYNYPLAFQPNGKHTENHKFQIMALAFQIAEMYKTEKFDPKDGAPVPMKSGGYSDPPEDYHDYWVKSFIAYMTDAKDYYDDEARFRHLSEGISEKNSHTYLETYIGDMINIRDFADHPMVSKTAEMYHDLLIMDYGSVAINGIIAGIQDRTATGEGATGLINNYAHVMFDNTPFIGSFNDTGYLWGNWATSAALSSDYNPTHPDFPKALIALMHEKPASGYLHIQARFRSDKTGQITGAARIWVKPHYALGFTLNWRVMQDQKGGGFYVTHNGVNNRSAVQSIIPFCCSTSDFGNKNANSQTMTSITADDVSIVKIGSGGSSRIWIDNDFSTDLTASWMFAKSKRSHNGKTVYAAVRPSIGGTSSDGSQSGGTVWKLNSTGISIWFTGDSDQYDSFADFKSAVDNSSVSDSGSWVKFSAPNGQEVWYNKGDNTNHQVNGKTITYTDNAFKVVAKNNHVDWTWGKMQMSINIGGHSAQYNFDPQRKGKLIASVIPVKTLNGITPTTKAAPSNLRVLIP
jgi:hypothetical protein